MRRLLLHKGKGVLFFTLLFIAFGTKSNAQFVVAGSAKALSPHIYQLTSGTNSLSGGGIWAAQKIDLASSFEKEFLLYFGTKDAAGGDGMAFIMHNDSRKLDAIGEVGEGLYYADVPSISGDLRIAPSVAIEFDTYQNTSCGNVGGINDPIFDHTTVVYHGGSCYPKFAPVRILPTKDNVEDGGNYLVKIKWIPGTENQPDELSLFVNGVHRFTHRDFMVQNILRTNMVYFGITGATGGVTNEQVVTVVEGNSNPQALDDVVQTNYAVPVDIDVLANDNDPDGSPVFTTAISVSPRHGSAEIVDKNKIVYTPQSGFVGNDSLEYQICDISYEGAVKTFGNCSNAWVKINIDNCPDYILNVQKIKDNVRCHSEGIGNGAAVAYIIDGNRIITEGFTIKWYQGFVDISTAKQKAPVFVGSHPTNLSHGNYTVIAELTTSGNCPLVDGLTIFQQEEYPEYTIDITKNISPCGGSDGEMRVIFSDPEVNDSDFTFTWNNENNETVGSTIVASNLSPGVYTVIVTNKITGCAFPQQMELEDEHLILFDLAITERISDCSGTNGAIKIMLPDNFYISEYTFDWSVNGKNFSNSNLEENNLSSGVYTVTVTRKTTGCKVSKEISLVNEHIQKTPSFVSVNRSNCTQPDGKLSGSVDGNSSDYDFFWSVKEDRLFSNPFIGVEYTHLTAGEYWLTAKNKMTGCFTDTILASVPISDPAILNVTVLVEKGSLIASLQEVDYQWVDCKNNIPVEGATERIFEPLNGGTYRVEVTLNGCTSSSPCHALDIVNSPSDLTATGQEKSILLQWTDNSDNEEGFVIERFNDDEAMFTVIAAISTDVTSYEDLSVKDGNIYSYRIYGFNSSEKSLYSNMASAKLLTVTGYENLKSTKINVYPNPGNGMYNVHLNEIPGKEVNISVTDLLGNQVVKSRHFSNEIKDKTINLDLTPIDNGIYLLHVKIGRTLLTHKVIKR